MNLPRRDALEILGTRNALTFVDEIASDPTIRTKVFLLGTNLAIGIGRPI